MRTHFLTVEVALPSSPGLLHQVIVTELQKRGEPLRWAIVAVNSDRQTATLEAVVTTPDESLIPVGVKIG